MKTIEFKKNEFKKKIRYKYKGKFDVRSTKQYVVMISAFIIFFPAIMICTYIDELMELIKLREVYYISSKTKKVKQ